ncbi:hypothetical protein WI460_12560 [Gemmatimonadota bacterium Y43]|uniref:hypothetical protein n=1 Tax=Gaopeijia maritima TaxID=3119007 RepID=UPI00326DC7B4
MRQGLEPDLRTLGAPPDHRAPWVKVVGFLQHNWAVIAPSPQGSLIVFYGDTAGVFDWLLMDDQAQAEDALRRNGFERYEDGSELASAIPRPRGDFRFFEHPNGRIYSSGRFWK